MTTKIKTRTASFEADTDDGVVEMLVATYDIDSASDQIIPGAFTDTLADWRAKGDPIPFIWSHKHDDPEMHIGYVLEAEERHDGLWIKAQVDIDEPIGRKVFKLLKGRRVTQASFAYDILEGGWVTREGKDEVYELRKMKLYEVGPTLIGMNQATELIAAKQDDPVVDEQPDSEPDKAEDPPGDKAEDPMRGMDALTIANANPAIHGGQL